MNLAASKNANDAIAQKVRFWCTGISLCSVRPGLRHHVNVNFKRYEFSAVMKSCARVAQNMRCRSSVLKLIPRAALVAGTGERVLSCALSHL